MTPPLRAGIYARISKSDPTVEATADQERRCRDLAAREGYEVVATFADDGISAYSGKTRPDWVRLTSAIDRGSIDVILAVAEDRFARNAAEKIGLQVACAKRGVRWHTIGGGLVDPATAGGALMSTITAGIAQYESQIKSERVAASIVRRRLEGSDIGGPRPFGFSTDRRSLVESEASLVREAHAMLLAGKTMYAVTKLFIDSGVPTVRGGAWSYLVAAKIMRRPRNAALAVTEDGTTYALTQHPAIVSREDHEAVVALLSTGKRTGRRPQHLASGSVARCGSCGAPMRYSGQKGMYRCVAGNRGLTLSDGRVHASAKVEDVDRAIIAEVVPALAARLQRGDSGEADSAALRLLIAERAEVERQRDAAQELWTLPGANLAKLRVTLAALEEQREALDEQIIGARLNGSAAIQTIARSLLDGAPAGSQLGAQFTERWSAMSLDEQRDLVRALLDVRIYPISVAKEFMIVRDEDGNAEVVVTREGPDRISIRRL